MCRPKRMDPANPGRVAVSAAGSAIIAGEVPYRMPIEQMNVSLPPRMARFIRGKVKAGEYTNASEVVRDAVRHMQKAEAAKDPRAVRPHDFAPQLTVEERESVRSSVQRGVKDFEEGRY